MRCSILFPVLAISLAAPGLGYRYDSIDGLVSRQAAADDLQSRSSSAHALARRGPDSTYTKPNPERPASPQPQRPSSPQPQRPAYPQSQGPASQQPQRPASPQPQRSTSSTPGSSSSRRKKHDEPLRLGLQRHQAKTAFEEQREAKRLQEMADQRAQFAMLMQQHDRRIQAQIGSTTPQQQPSPPPRPRTPSASSSRASTTNKEGHSTGSHGR